MSAYLELGLLPRNPFDVDRPRRRRRARRGSASIAGRTTTSGLKVGVCGEHGGDPESIATFYEAGLDYVSCSPFRVPVARLASARRRFGRRPLRRAGRGDVTGASGRRTRRSRPASRDRAAHQRFCPELSPVAIPDEDVAQVRAATDIVALVGEHSALRRQGRRWVGLARSTPKRHLVQRERRGGLLLLLRVPGVGRRHQLRAGGRPPRLRRRGPPPGRPGRESPSTRTPGRSDRKRRTELLDAMERAVRLVSRASAVGPRCRPRP